MSRKTDEKRGEREREREREGYEEKEIQKDSSRCKLKSNHNPSIIS